LRGLGYTAAFATLVCLVVTCTHRQAMAAASPASGAGAYLTKSWTTENGLPQNSVTSIVQTRDGYLWLGTLGGLARFDGVQFTVFNTVNTPGLVSNRIRALYEDTDGGLWIGSEHGGLTRYIHGIFTNYSRRDGLNSDTVISLAGDGAGGLWVGTVGGLVRWQHNTFKAYGTETGLPHTAIDAICVDSQGTLWLGAFAFGLVRFDGARTIAYPLNTGRVDNVWSIHEAQGGGLWVGTENGLNHFDGTRFSAELMPDGHPTGYVKSFYGDGHHVVWAATSRGTLRLPDHPEVPSIASDWLPGTNVHSVFFDREQNLWTGSEAVGLERWSKSTVRAFTADEGFTDQPTMATLQAHDGTIWIGALGSPKLFVYKEGKFSSYLPRRGRIDSPASLAQDNENKLWLGDWYAGLGRLDVDKGQITAYTLPNVSPDVAPALNAVRSLYFDDEGFLWIGSDQTGLYSFKGGAFVHYGVGDGLPNNISFITRDHLGALWVGTPTSIGRLTEGRFTTYTAAGLSLVRTLHEDAAGALWIGTYGQGLFRFKDGKFVRITTTEGLFDNVASSILDDQRGNFWISGNRGIYRARQEDLNQFADGRLDHIDCISYGVADGMAVSETNGGGEPSGLRAHDGKLWFPMIKGIVVIDPGVINTQPPPVAIEQVTLDGKELPRDELIRISPGSNDLQIRYTALSLTRPEHILFKYQLAGYDQHWVDAGTRRTAYYSHLPPGNYGFTVIADNGEGVWNTVGRTLSIRALPPFWRTWWFLAFAVGLLLGLVTMAYRIRAESWRRRYAAREAFSRQLLISQEAERKRIAAELHDSLGQSLLIIKNRAVLALGSDDETAREQLDEISSAASQAVEEVREISYNLHPYQLDRFGLTRTLQAVCERASELSGLRFSADVETIDGLFPPDAESSLYRIIQEAVNNILRHSHAEEATLAIHRKSGELQICVKDNGQGFREEERDPMKPKREGFGLMSITERVRTLKGRCEITSVAGQGTFMSIHIPIPEATHAS
jgi:signal transduction histidine kinase/ligand-binding sensor domain-containing protein